MFFFFIFFFYLFDTILRGTFPPSPFYILCLFPSVELQKANLEAQNTQTPGSGTTPGASGASASPSTTTTTASPLASAIPLAQLLSKPGALNALSSLTALGGLTELLGGAAGAAASALPVQTTGVHRSHKTFTPRLRSPGAPGPTDSGKFKSERTKYNPYWTNGPEKVAGWCVTMGKHYTHLHLYIASTCITLKLNVRTDARVASMKTWRRIDTSYFCY